MTTKYRSNWTGKTIPLVLLFTIVFIQCNTAIDDHEEEVNLVEILPEGAIAELAQGHPDLKVTFVTEKSANVSVMYGEKYLRLDGIEDDKARERIAKYVLQYMENPNKREEDKARREVYDNLPPKEKMGAFVERIKSRHPDFNYEWVGLEEGNVKKNYGDNSLIIKGIEDEGSREEIAYGLIQIQKDIDKLSLGEQE